MQSTDIADLVAAIDRDRAERARREPPGEKLLDGERLFHWACQMAASGIRHDHPDWDDAQVLAEIKRRIELQRHLERRHVG